MVVAAPGDEVRRCFPGSAANRQRMTDCMEGGTQWLTHDGNGGGGGHKFNYGDVSGYLF